MKRTFLFGAVVLAAAGCSPPPPDPSVTAAAAATPTAAFTVPEAQRGHLEIVAAHLIDEPSVLHLTGTVDWDNERTTQAITQVNGPITRIVVDTGRRVKAGDPLLYVSSPDIAGAMSALRKAKNRLDQAQRTLDRNRDLLEHKAISQREFDDSQSDLNDAATDLQTAQQALKILGVADGDLSADGLQTGALRAELPMRAPIGGVVVQKLVLPGQVIQAGTTLAFVISDTSSVWVQAHLYEKDLRALHVGDPAEVRDAAFADVFRGRVAYIGDMIDPATRTTLVRIVTANPSGFLKKDLFVDVTIHGPARHGVLVVPTTAVLYDEQDMPFVYVEESAGRFQQRQVAVGAQQGGNSEITNGLKPDERVVGQGSLFLQFANNINR